MFRRIDPFGNPNVGVYVRATDSHLFVPPGLTPQNLNDLEQALGLKPTVVTVGGAELIGSLVAANKNGCVLADFASDRELKLFEAAGLAAIRLETSRLNAAGNNILANDRGALVHPDLPARAVEAIERTLGVPVERGLVAGLPTVGSAAFATALGVLCHPLASDAELAFIKKTLHANARIGTVNHGHGLVGAGIAANTNGVACGSRTTGIELGRIDEALGFLEKETPP
ncbi:MAG: translation initiation factor IF-6 [Thermoplasmatota archaeon]|nr:translation initiation factor IF-6 [Halobacteriales archaeon]